MLRVNLVTEAGRTVHPPLAGRNAPHPTGLVQHTNSRATVLQFSTFITLQLRSRLREVAGQQVPLSTLMQPLHSTNTITTNSSTLHKHHPSSSAARGHTTSHPQWSAQAPPRMVHSRVVTRPLQWGRSLSQSNSPNHPSEDRLICFTGTWL